MNWIPPEVVTVYRTSKIARMLEAYAMSVAFDLWTDTLTIVFREGVAVAARRGGTPGVILDWTGRCELPGGTPRGGRSLEATTLNGTQLQEAKTTEIPLDWDELVVEDFRMRKVSK